MQADRSLIGTNKAIDIIGQTATGIDDTTCGASRAGTPNNTYGAGLLNAIAALDTG